MKFFYFPLARAKAVIRHQRPYARHVDPATQATNAMALVLAWSMLFYPFFVLAFVGIDALPRAFLTYCAAPFFYAIPWLNRHNSLAGRVALPLLGAANTVWCLSLFGAGSGVGLFFYPCIILVALLYRQRERWLMLTLLGIILVLSLMPRSPDSVPILTLTSDELDRLSALNILAVAVLIALITLQFAGVARAVEKAADPSSP